MSELNQIAAQLKMFRSELGKTKAQLLSNGNSEETANRVVGALADIIDAFDTVHQAVNERDALLAEMSGALAQLMGTADEPEDKNRAAYFKEGMSRARAVQEMYSRQLGNG